MARSANNTVLDALLDHILTNGDRIDVCSTEPTSYAEATSTYTLANTTLTTGDSSGGDYLIADGVSGRKVTIDQQTDVSITGTGDAEHIAITNGTDTLLFVTTCTLQGLTSGGTVTIPAFEINVTDPVAP